MKIVLGLCLSLLCLTSFGQDIRLYSIVFNSKSYQNISKENSFDLGEIIRTGESGQTFVLHFTNTSDSPLYIEQIITGDDMVGNKKDELIASGKNGRLEFNFLTQHAGNRTQHITIRCHNQMQESQLAFSVKYVVLEKSYNHRVSGKVIDAKTGDPIPFVFVMIGKTQQETQTDFEGLYSLEASTNDTLSYYTVGMITQKWRADKQVINVSMQETELLEVVYGPPIEPRNYRPNEYSGITAEDIKYANNPRYVFRRNAERNVYLIFVGGTPPLEISQGDVDFQKKYNVVYSLQGSYSEKFVRKYNRLSFRYLNRKYGRDWVVDFRQYGTFKVST